ncbi:alpha/beta fold hydrolase [Frigidibacter albus]|uniref:Alpha/beta fold hydrolase n=1 Tax=Frigidibacter albus TaxID=1465486 RepID=A0A6L8VM83_9RHOB|nr:alpha/beta fold hydrolase [Frigidibacter albus]MZQ90240.1 alpha/beta fold hydrolase [Frigidibacter albus]NBE32262.1 alpha/beta fold hydrolase [Frigidibacter albus]GGH58307.1 salicylate esterase [Frigidibacter albus]
MPETASEPIRIILVHGAWSRASTWGDVPARLAALGHDVIAPDLPGHGDDPADPSTITLADYASRLATILRAGPPALLVGHSMGGMAISAAAELAPDHVARLVYVCAFLPQDGEGLLDLMKRQPPTIRPAVRPGPLPGTTLLDAATALPLLAQDADPAAQAGLAASIGPQPNRPQTDRIQLSPGNFGRLPRAYILCEEDRTITPALQRDMIAASPCAPVLSLPTGHFPQISAPDRLARLLADLAIL